MCGLSDWLPSFPPPLQGAIWLCELGKLIWVEGQKEPGAICKRLLLLVISTAISLCTRFLGGWWILTWWACDLSSCLDQNQGSSPANSALTLALTSTQHCAPPRSSCGSTLFSSLESTSVGLLPSSPSSSWPGSQSPLCSLQDFIWGPSKEQQIWGKWEHHLWFVCPLLFCCGRCRLVQWCGHTGGSLLLLESQACFGTLPPLIPPTLGLKATCVNSCLPCLCFLLLPKVHSVEGTKTLLLVLFRDALHHTLWLHMMVARRRGNDFAVWKCKTHWFTLSKILSLLY